MTTVRARRLIPAAVAVVAILVMAGCGSDDESSATSTGTTPGTELPTATDAVSGTTVVTAPRTTPPWIPTTPTTPAPTTVPGLISVTVGVDSSPDRIEPVALGSEVTLVVLNPDADDEFHLHGFDLGDGAVVPAGQPATFTFTANEAGSFELESHLTDEVYLVLEVS
jgi:hypothetical protein